MTLSIDTHPLLDLRAFITEFPDALGRLTVDDQLLHLLSLSASAPLKPDDQVRSAVRDLLRFGGFKPTGRSKPASEYLLKAAAQNELAPINVAVDACNAVSLHSGLPISVVDLDLLEPPLRIGLAPAGTGYVFNASGQTIDVGGLLCLFDSAGACASPVKDSQRTKTNPETRRTLTLIWGTTALDQRARQTEAWYQKLLESHGCQMQPA
jgi:DNA/RNA-binding domain of Phe-tRNA-synthetase-like protein